jgi:outer membrane immunogenic protein
MKYVTRIGIAAACVAAPLTAQAADLGRVPPGYQLRPQVVANWTACYVGINMGGGWVQASVADFATGTSLGGVTPAGFIGGGQVGCDFQFGQFVFGFQGMADAADVRGSILQPNGAVTTSFNVPWIETLTARVGYTVTPVTLLYLKGGAAWVEDKVFTSVGGTTFATGIITPMGWTVGLGAEFLFYRNWSAFVEYNYLGFGNNKMTLLTTTAGSPVPINVNHNVQTFLVGVNFRFSAPGSPSPASY